eukprot:TRINITY_DN5204_c0_g2_i1.p1 TRINITY_DN5204_c0_g2~~TRINITY_DN5204_c0_g2_i1.p1  ORF type:complete len:357 (+),score=89.39 TRINITY_DN5204_c0_g2_i1:64-1134(+)
MSEIVEKHVLRKYELCQQLGKGAYGIVWKAIDKKSRKVVALKKCFDAFCNSTDAQRTYREIMYLEELNGHDNIVRLINVVRAENDLDIYLVFDYMETDLHCVIRAKILEDVHQQYVIYQLIKCLKFMHSGDLIHRDIKPSNLLLNADCHLKLCDFGLCRSVAEVISAQGKNSALTDYVATRWYRAPEILLGSTKYSKAVDMWAVGCILGEMLTASPIFPGSSTMEQVERIIDVTGRPSDSDVDAIGSPFAATMLDSIKRSKPVSMSELFPSASPEALDLLKLCLTFNPSKRVTAAAALRHPYVARFHNPDDEPSCPRAISINLDDNTKLTADDYRTKMYKEIIRRKKEARKRRGRD